VAETGHRVVQKSEVASKAEYFSLYCFIAVLVVRVLGTGIDYVSRNMKIEAGFIYL
jgi:hypothetical protein